MVNAFGCLPKSPQTVTLPETNSELTPGKYAMAPKGNYIVFQPSISGANLLLGFREGSIPKITQLVVEPTHLKNII